MIDFAGRATPFYGMLSAASPHRLQRNMTRNRIKMRLKGFAVLALIACAGCASPYERVDANEAYDLKTMDRRDGRVMYQ